jgi:hypothetical protein
MNNYLWYFLEACIVVLIMYAIPKIWASTFTLPTLPKLPQIPSIPKGISAGLEPYQQVLVFLTVAFFTISIVEKWASKFFISLDQESPELPDDGKRLSSNLGTFGTYISKK